MMFWEEFLVNPMRIFFEESYTYSGFQLLTETNKEGNTTIYSYDGAGRKIKEDQFGRITEFSYDPLGRVSCICKHNGENALSAYYTRDLLGRVLKEGKKDSLGNLLYEVVYTYDADGNQATTSKSISGNQATEMFTYDSFGRPTLYVDAMQKRAETVYDERYCNELGQKVLRVITKDPKGITTFSTQDPFGRVVKEEVADEKGISLSSKELRYDPCGNLVEQRDHVFAKGEYEYTQTIRYAYTSTHKQKSMTRENSKTTAYTYFPSGKLQTKTLPNGVTLFHT